MIDSGCSPLGFIDTSYAQRNNIPLATAPRPRTLRLADGTIAGTVSQCCIIQHTLAGLEEELLLYAWPLEGADIILGLPWLRRHNPTIDWQKGSLQLGGTTATETRGPRHASDATPDTSRANTDLASIRALKATNFLLSCKKPGTQVQAMTLQKFLDTTDALAAIQLRSAHLTDNRSVEEIARETPTGLVRKALQGSDLTEGEELPKRLQAYHDWVNEAPWLRRVTDEDIGKYLEGKTPLTKSQLLDRLPAEYHDLVDAFLPQNAESLPPHRPFDHKIDLMPGATPPNYRARPMSPQELLAIRRYLDEHLAKGFIRASTSSAAAPILLARKPGGGLRVCVDYRGLNNVTVKNRYPIPLIRETLDALQKAKIYTKLDITAAFNRLRIAPGDEWKTAFITRFGLFECLVANFGMTGAPSSFQHYINNVLFDILDHYATAYLDDILIYSNSPSEHRRHVREVLQRLIKAGLTIDISKCEFGVKKTKYLGLIISTKGISMDPEKVRAIQEWEPPRTLRDLQRFVGFANYYRRFIRGFSLIARPLTNIMGRRSWQGDLTEDELRAFRDLKDAFTTAPVLAYYSPEYRTTIEVDASDWASGGVLYQTNKAGERHPVAFFSAKHTPAECNYEIYDKELLAIVKAFEEWRPELQGCEEAVEVITDHKSLQYFATTKLLNQRQVRWSEFLNDFRFQITYRPGHKATVPDALSRRPGDKPSNTQDTSDDRIANRTRVLLPPERWTGKPLPPLRLYALEDEEPIETAIDRAYKESPVAKAILDTIESPTARQFPAWLKKQFRVAIADCTARQGRIYVKDRLFIPEHKATRLTIIHRSHSAAPAGHPGRFKTWDLIKRTYFWPNMSRDVAEFVKGCHLCQRTKNSRSSPAGFLEPLPVPFRPWTDISVDYVGPLPPCQRNGIDYKHVLVVVDRLTKMRHFIAVPDTQASTLANAFVSEVFRLHGTPETIVSDRGSQFVSSFWRELSRRLKMRLSASTAYHPETDGQTEIINAMMEQYLRGYCNYYQDDWADWLPLAEFATNNQTSEATGLSPFFANYGWHPSIGTEPRGNATDQRTKTNRDEFLTASNVADRIQRVVDRTRTFMSEAQDRYTAASAAHRSDAARYKVGDRVWVSTKNIRTTQPTAKLADRWLGPVEVTKVYQRAVAVKLADEYNIFPVFHTSLLRPAHQGIDGQSVLNQEHDDRAKGIVIQDNNGAPDVKWVFETILDAKRLPSKGIVYKIKWPAPHRPTWEPAKNLEGCDSEIMAFHHRHPSKPGPPRWVKRQT